jgi:hypothetical protein
MRTRELSEESLKCVKCMHFYVRSVRLPASLALTGRHSTRLVTNTSRAVSSGLSGWSFICNSLDGRGRHGDGVTIGFEIDGRLAGDGTVRRSGVWRKGRCDRDGFYSNRCRVSPAQCRLWGMACTTANAPATLGEFRLTGFRRVLGVKLRGVLMPKLNGKTLVSKLLRRCFSFFCKVSRVSLPESFSASENFFSLTPPSVAFFPPLRAGKNSSLA